jgi:hypothetical protein
LRTKTIISWDDDIIATSRSVDKAFETYVQQNWTTRITGPFGRGCRGDVYTFSHRNHPLVLTGLAFLRIDMLELYHHSEYQIARTEVRRLDNGEDILMNFITMSVYHTKPILQSISLRFHSSNGISSSKRHLQTRNYLCGFFQRLFGSTSSLRGNKSQT